MMKLHWDKLQPAKLRNTMWNDVITDVADEYRLVDEDKQVATMLAVLGLLLYLLRLLYSLN